MKRFLLLALLSGCWGSCPNCPGWEATPKAGFERVAAARLRLCVQGNPCALLHSCFEASWAYCLDAGYQKECGQMEPEGTCGEAIK